MLALKRLSWFSIEFGLIDEQGETKVFGAGHPVLARRDPVLVVLVCRTPAFVTDEVIATDYDSSRMQDLLFVIPSLPFLRAEVETLVRRFGMTVN